MSAPFSVLLRGADPAIERHRQVLATLLGHFRVVADGPADVELVTGGNPGCARLLVLSRPEHAAQWTPPPGRRVVPVLRLLPIMRGDASFAAARSTSFALIDVTATIPKADHAGIAAALLEVLAAYRGLVGTGARVTHVHRFAGGLTATLTGGPGKPLCTLALTESNATPGSWRFWATGEATRYVFELNETGSARPATIRLFDSSGAIEAPQTYQHADRQTWLDVYMMLMDAGLQPAYSGDQLREDLEIVELLSGAEPVRAMALI